MRRSLILAALLLPLPALANPPGTTASEPQQKLDLSNASPACFRGIYDDATHTWRRHDDIQMLGSAFQAKRVPCPTANPAGAPNTAPHITK